MRMIEATHYRVRWTMFAFLFLFGAMGYIQRTGVAITADRMVPELGLSQTQLGWLLNAFLVSYTVCQVPAALIGQRLGARLTLAGISVLTVAAAAAGALVPPGHAGVLVFLFLLSGRLVLGVAQAALYPVASGMLETWFPVGQWGVAQGLLVTGLWLGTAATPPLVAWLMSQWGWRAALLLTSVPSLVIVWVWQRAARDRPQQHPRVRAAELEELRGNPPPPDRHAGLRDALRLIKDREMALLTLSYFLMNYVFYLVTFWCFLYLVQERHFALLEGGGLASLPFIAAAVAAALGGGWTDRLCARFGVRKGIKFIPVLALPVAATFLVLTGVVQSAAYAVTALTLAFAFTEITEGAYWSAAMRIAPTEAMASTAVLNMGGNLGGVIATPTIAVLTEGHHWTSVFVLGALLSLLAALLWLLLRIDHSPHETRSES